MHCEHLRQRGRRAAEHGKSVRHSNVCGRQDILRVSLADKVHNARAILRDLRKPGIGEKVWNRFNAPKKLQLWYYRNLADTFREMMPGQLSDELHEIVEALEA